ncbi:hypothetical protein HaLaN_06310 [Haematococcus lacustris]|uniref:Uncharacterized protein n=1 Tax=Haematococcus lacustris TaxID=44745 RepID=A0A699YV69_HAELA|nr:hypothetical protein HaLaN_06310 [Haematococcus lacustris]
MPRRAIPLREAASAELCHQPSPWASISWCYPGITAGLQLLLPKPKPVAATTPAGTTLDSLQAHTQASKVT